MIQFYKSQTCLDLSKDDEILKNCPKWLKFEQIGNRKLTLTTTTKLFQGPRAKRSSRSKIGLRRKHELYRRKKRKTSTT